MLRILPRMGSSMGSRIVPEIVSSMMVNSMMNQEPKQDRGMGSNSFAQMEKKVYQERNGQVIDDKYIKETISDGKMKVEGYDNGKPIYFVRDLGKKVLRKESRKVLRKEPRKILRKEPRKILRKKLRKTVKQIKTKRRLTKSRSRK